MSLSIENSEETAADVAGRAIRVLVVDDEAGVRLSLEKALSREGFLMTTAANGEEALRAIKGLRFDVVLLDQGLPGRTGVEILKELRAGSNAPKVVMFTGLPEVEGAVEAMKLGAYDYVGKPLDLANVSRIIRNAAERHRLEKENTILRHMVAQRPFVGPVVCESPQFQAVLALAKRVSRSNAPVLVSGETGTGKGLLAKILHQESLRSAEAFIQLNCGALQEQLFESELFGHKKGSFTGALHSKPGLFEVADGGTLFLDEIAELSSGMQAKLLHVLDTGEMRRVGGTNTRTVDARVISATNKDLKEEVKEGRFREDLFFRLNVVRLVLPPLRERREDIEGLVRHYLARFQLPGEPAKLLSSRAMEMLLEYAWPGNVRELANTIETLVLLTHGEKIVSADLPSNLQPGTDIETGVSEGPLPLNEIERLHIMRTLDFTEGLKAKAARILKIDVKTLNRKIEAYKIKM